MKRVLGGGERSSKIGRVYRRCNSVRLCGSIIHFRMMMKFVGTVTFRGSCTWAEYFTVWKEVSASVCFVKGFAIGCIKYRRWLG